MIAVYATPCSGTRYTARALNAIGLDVGHEKLGPDGFVCGWALWEMRKIRNVEPTRTVALIRDPRRVMETLPGYSRRVRLDGSWPPWMSYSGDPQRAALRWWVLTYERLHGMGAETLRLGDADGFLRLFGQELPEGIEYQSKRGTRYPRPTWEKFALIDADLTARARVVVDRMRL